MNYVAYYRVSTDRQGIRGLGMEAQQAAVLQHVNGHGKLIGDYREVESGRKRKRPELLKAIAHAKRSKATLVVAKLDRLARNVAFTATLMESGVKFVACDMPSANHLTIHILAAVAQAEAEAASIRTKEALAAYKARGGKLGADHPSYRQVAPQNLSEAQKAGSTANREAATEAYADLLPVMREWRDFGLSYRQIADRLNSMGHTTRFGQPWHRIQVRRVLDR